MKTIHSNRLWLLLYLSILIFSAPRFSLAQATGWSEQRHLQHHTSINNRVSLPVVAADGDNVYIAYRQTSIKMIISRDRGKNWGAPIELGPNYQVTSAPAICVVNSKVVVVWPAQVESGENLIYQLMMVESNNNGRSWSNPRRITSSNEHTFSPRFYVENGVVYMLWLETPPETISTRRAIEFTPESLANLSGTISDSLQEQRTQTRSVFYTSIFNPSDSSFSPPSRVSEISSARIPHVFSIYGRVDGNIHVTFNQNQNIRTFRSPDGVEWSPYFQDKTLFSSQRMGDVGVVNDTRVSTWIERTAYQQVIVNFERDGESPVQLSSPHFVRSIPRFVYNEAVYHVVWEAGEENESWITYMRTDQIPPSSEMVLPTSPDVKNLNITFAWVGEDNISSNDRLQYSYRYAETWSPIQSETQTTIKAPPDGEYVFEVRAQDVAGNIQEDPAAFDFNTYNVAPNTAITERPDSGQVLKHRSVTIAFVNEDNNDSPEQLQYQVQVDDGAWSKFQNGQEHRFENLSNGTHILRIRSRDTRGNVEPSPSEVQVKVYVALEIVWGPDLQKYTNADTVVFDWNAQNEKGEPVQLTYFYQLNENDPVELGKEPSVQFDDLEEGRHELIVWGQAESGDATPRTSHHFTIDRTPPETQAVFEKEYSNKFPIVKLTTNDPNLPDGTKPLQPTQYEYRLNEGEWQSFTKSGNTWTIPKPLAFYSWGYIIHVRGIDAAGNIDPTPAMINLRIYARTNPYIFWPVVVILAAILLYLLYFIFKKLGGRGGRRATVSSTTTASTMSFDEEDSYSTGESDWGSSFDFDEEDEDKKKDDDDPFA